MSAAQMLPADAPEDEAARVQAEREATWRAQEEFHATKTATFEVAMEEMRAIVCLERPGASLDEARRKLGEAAHDLRNQNQHMGDLKHRWAREDAGEIRQEKARLRETKPASSIRWKNLATPLLNAMGVNSEFGRDDDRLLNHAVLVELGIGEDMSADEQRAEAFTRLVRHAGSYVDSDLKLAIVETVEGVVTRMSLAGQCLPALPMPDDEEGQRLHHRLLTLERAALEEFRGHGPVPTRTEQERARQVAWHRLMDEERQSVPPGMSSQQRQQQIAQLVPEWAGWAGIMVR
ncbi:hypothetical protein [Neoroseomonas oryzicola]|uniref:Uncharacterized protein n=1 Tax=Neoroseomonas oryzicola TaxID=535904 RepID=A0A9X9WLX3_9PROT|nr:hypothetical protein [Neoroseomonas oryzicola]MBR0661333.1 hypothetical protein [Neoroseomonas oryzicola]NKE18823.1 hypothetical protein [Neoroseomonas oryzicola]